MFLISHHRHSAGFSLIELAVVLVVVSLLIGYLIMPLSVQRENRNILEARNQLKEIEEALYGFAIANGRLPCPTMPGQAGVEQPAGGSTASGVDDCANGARGFIPAATLGLSGAVNCDGLLTDPWGQPYRYSVATTQTNAYTNNGSVNGSISDIGIDVLGPLNNLRVCNNAACGAGQVVTSFAVAVVYSIGKNWATFGSADENQNAGEATLNSNCVPPLPAYGLSNDNSYVSRERSDVAGQEYDDIMIWISPNILFAKMLSAGQL